MSDVFYTEAVASVRGLLKTVSEYMNGLDIYPRASGIFLDAVMLAMVSKNLRVGEATCLLVDNGFHDEAFGLSRTMFEVALSARYISNADDWTRSARYVKYYAKDHEGWTQLVGKYYPNATVEFHAEHQKMLEMAKQFKDPHRWSGQSVKQMALEEDAFDVDESGKPFKWEYDYEVIYKWTSHFVHGTVVALDDHASDARTAFRVRGGRQNIEKGGMALFNVVFYLLRTLVSAFRSIQYEIQKEVLEEFEGVLKGLTHV